MRTKADRRRARSKRKKKIARKNVITRSSNYRVFPKILVKVLLVLAVLGILAAVTHVITNHL